MYNLLGKIQKVILILVTISFVALVTGFTLHLHLLSHEHFNNRCTICQLLHTTPTQLAPESQIIAFGIVLFENGFEFLSLSPPITFHHEPFGPRPPPAL
jgi:hypothetical protein